MSVVTVYRCPGGSAALRNNRARWGGTLAWLTYQVG